MVERVYKMDCQTNPPGGAYIANVNVKGIPLSAIMEKAGVDSSANACTPLPTTAGTCIRSPWNTCSSTRRHPAGNGDKRREAGDAPGLSRAVVDAHAGRVSLHQARRRTDFTADPRARTTRASPTPRPARCSTSRTRPFSTTRTARSSRGQAIEFEGFADAYEVPITAVEISLDKGKTWTRSSGRDRPLRWVNWKFSFTPETRVVPAQGARVAADGSVSTDPSQLFFNVK